MSQRDAIYRYMATRGIITPMIAYERCGSLRLSERIREIERRGHIVKRSWQQIGDKRVMGYYLELAEPTQAP